MNAWLSNIKAQPRHHCNTGKCNHWVQCVCGSPPSGQKPQFFVFEAQLDTGRNGAVVVRMTSQLFNRLKDQLKDGPKKFVTASIVDCHATSHKYITDIKNVNHAVCCHAAAIWLTIRFSVCFSID